MRTNRECGSWKLKTLISLLVLGFEASTAAQNPPSLDRAPDRVLLVSIPDRKLLVVEREQVIAAFPIAVGAAESPSPAGEFQIINRVTNPTYYRPGSVIPSGKDNPIGTRWLGLSKKGYGIHGTNAPKSVGRAASHGCIRLRNRDIERLFSMVHIGDRVEIHAQRDEQIVRVFESKDQNEVAGTSAAISLAGGQ
jgi:lipoprotein-anchoring transpeptidase ErfK/SrfK